VQPASRETPSRSRKETNGERAGILELATLELLGALLDRSLELLPILNAQLVVIGQQHLHIDALDEFDGVIEHDLSVPDVSSYGLHDLRLARQAPLDTIHVGYRRAARSAFARLTSRSIP